MKDLEFFLEKMKKAKASALALASFTRLYSLFREKSACDFFIPEESIQPIKKVHSLSSKNKADDFSSQAVVIKLNGGLGTTMGLKGLKSHLPVKGEKTFLEIISQQIQNSQGANLALMQTRNYPSSSIKEAEVFFQYQAPKIDAETFLPAESLENRNLEFYPLGHGDAYASLGESGLLEKWIKKGKKVAFISNADNLGATLDKEILAYFLKSKSEFLMEVAPRTSSDTKGGHLAIDKKTGKYLLREIAQCPEKDKESFVNPCLHRYFNTNNLWIKLEALRNLLKKHQGILPLPLILNRKTFDAKNPNSKAIIQLETAMGTAIQLFDSDLIEVSRKRFLPVKKISDLWLLRSDVYHLEENGHLNLQTKQAPKIDFDESIRFLADLEEMGAIPSLKEAKEIEIKGNISFEEGVILKGKVKIHNTKEETFKISSGTYKNETLSLYFSEKDYIKLSEEFKKLEEKGEFRKLLKIQFIEINHLLNQIFWTFFSRGKRKRKLLDEIKGYYKENQKKLPFVFVSQEIKKFESLEDLKKLSRTQNDFLGKPHSLKILQNFFEKYPEKKDFLSDNLCHRFLLFEEKKLDFLETLEFLEKSRQFFEHYKCRKAKKEEIDYSNLLKLFSLLLSSESLFFLNEQICKITPKKERENLRGILKEYLKNSNKKRKERREKVSNQRKESKRKKNKEYEKFKEYWQKQKKDYCSPLNFLNFYFSWQKISTQNIKDIESFIKSCDSRIKKVDFESIQDIFAICFKIDSCFYDFFEILKKKKEKELSSIRNRFLHNETLFQKRNKEIFIEELNILFERAKTKGLERDFLKQIKKILREQNYIKNSQGKKSFRKYFYDEKGKKKMEEFSFEKEGRKIVRRVCYSLLREIKRIENS